MQYLSFNVTNTLLKSLPGSEDQTKKRIIAGLAATEDLDWQGQQLLLKGIDFRYLKTGNGRLNWNHNNNYIIGEPTFVEMQPKGLYIECMLYQKQPGMNIVNNQMRQSLEKAEWAWDYANTIQKNGGSTLSYSVEGPAPKIRGNKIVKCILTKIALTDEPVNTSCSVSALAKSLQTALNDQKSLNNFLDINNIEDSYDLVEFLKQRGIEPFESVQLVKIIQQKVFKKSF